MAEKMIFNRVFAMPSADTFSIPPIDRFVRKYLEGSICSVDPFARNSTLCDFTNDLNPETASTFHMDAGDFLEHLMGHGVKADLVIFDPPYSPRQISECYKSIRKDVGMRETQNAALYSRVREAIIPILNDGAIVLSFGWNSCGMGKKHKATLIEMLLVPHGGAHNDTICIAERMP